MDQQLIVAGFHRSGTSFTTQLLHAGGLFVGDDLLGAMDSNPYGHFEDRVPFEIHKRILLDNGVDWQLRSLRPLRVSPERWAELRRYVAVRRSTQRLWGFKDPRVCMFLGVWKHLLPEARILVVFRDFRDVVWSLRRRHARNVFLDQGTPEIHEPILRDPDFAIQMWTAQNDALLSAVSRYPDDVMVVPLEAIQRGWPLIDRLNARFGLGLRRVAVEQVFDASATVSGGRPLPVRSMDEVRRAERTLGALWNAATL